jgi:uncharacterized membrane protein YGL010W
MTRSAQSWLDEYGESHQNPTNKMIHWICIPLIMLSLVMILGAIPLTAKIDLGLVALALASLYYFFLSIKLAIGMSAVSLGLVYFTGWTQALAQHITLAHWQLGVVIFVIAWIFQFIGHKIEGKKPSFFKDLQFLLIGPMWLMSFIYRKIGISYQ